MKTRLLFFLKRANIFQGQNPRALAEAVEGAEGEQWSWQGEGQISTNSGKHSCFGSMDR